MGNGQAGKAGIPRRWGIGKEEKSVNTYFALRQRMYGAQITQKDIAEHLHKGVTYVSHRFLMKQPWDMEDVYGICELLEIEFYKIPEYFPRMKRS